MLKRLFYLSIIVSYTTATGYSQSFTNPQGQGSMSNPYEITSIEDLYWVAMSVNAWNSSMEGRYFVQTQNIDAAATRTWNSGLGWQPIGDSIGVRFKGIYDGQGYALDGLFINRPTKDYAGLFGCTEGGAIKNVHLSNVDITAKTAVGAIAGLSLSPITNCSAQGAVAGDRLVGGIVGVNKASIRNSYSECTVSGANYSGGFVGRNAAHIEQCYTHGQVNGEEYLGGFVGENTSTISNCYSKTSVIAEYITQTCAGFAGRNTSIISKCFSTGQVKQSIVSANIVYTNYGFCAVNSRGSFAGNCLDTLVSLSPQSSSYYSALKNTAEMNDGKTFYYLGWDIKGIGKDEIWNIGNSRNDGYPYFDWQFPNDPAPILNIEPSLVSAPIDYSGGTSVIVSATIKENGSPKATDYGICWGTSTSPTVADNNISLGDIAGVPSFDATATGLEAMTRYYFRPYATSVLGTFYGLEKSVYVYPAALGTGKVNDPYLIATLGDLYWLQVQVNEKKNNFRNHYFLQTADIDASDTRNWNNGEGWDPIGDNYTEFYGNFNGAGYVIDKLYINRPNTSYVGLFGKVSGIKFKNIAVTDVDITGGNNTGALVGYFLKPHVIDSCYATGNVSGGNIVGGLAGTASTNHCFFEGAVTGIANVGGLTGVAVNISFSYSTGTVTGVEQAGGLTGYLNDDMSNSYSRSNVVRSGGDASSIGGLVGLLKSNNTLYADVNNCYASGSVSYSTAANPNDKGLFGAFEILGNAAAEPFVKNVMWDKETSGQLTDTSKMLGRTTADMLDADTYIAESWEFKGVGGKAIWNIGNGRNDGYPYLNWQYPNDPEITHNVPAYISFLEVINYDGNGVADFNTTITSAGIPKANQHGMCWNTTGLPTIADDKTTQGTLANAGSLSLQITGLSGNTVYFVRSYVTNSVGTFYSPEISFYTYTIPQGSGAEQDPYLIASLAELEWISYQSNVHKEQFTGKYFEQTADIDATATKQWNNGKGWKPIKNFAGNYNGNGFTIDGIYINRPLQDYVGLFGFLYDHSKTTGLGVTNANITGKVFVGALAGMINFGSVSHSFTTGTITGESEVGGMAGHFRYSHISNSYSYTDVFALEKGGGFLGYIVEARTLSNSYARGSVTRSSGTETSFGGFIGQSDNVHSIEKCYNTVAIVYVNDTNPTDKGFEGEQSYIVFNNGCFWDIDVTGQASTLNTSSDGLRTDLMKIQGVYENVGWQFSATKDPDKWMMSAEKNDGYPYLGWQKFTPVPEVITKPFSGKTATEFTANGELTAIGIDNPSAHGFCMGDVDMPTIATATELIDLGAASSLGKFSYTATSITDQCAFYNVRAFATNSEGTGYGMQQSVSFDTEKPVVSWDHGDQVIYTEPGLTTAVMPDYTSMLTIADNCGTDKLSYSHSFQPGAAINIGRILAQIRIRDRAGNLSAVNIYVTVEEKPLQQCTVNLKAGWNLISLNVDPTSTAAADVFPNASIVKTASEFYNASETAFLNSLTEIEAGIGYLVYNSKDETISISGQLVSSSVSPVGLLQGWNLIGVPIQTNFNVTGLPSETEIVKDFEAFYDPINNQGLLQELEPGKAYFMKVSGDCSLSW
jgi:hypothetical protein